jgi:hypothetical protein
MNTHHAVVVASNPNTTLAAREQAAPLKLQGERRGQTFERFQSFSPEHQGLDWLVCSNIARQRLQLSTLNPKPWIPNPNP